MIKHSLKRLLSMLLVVCMVVSMLPVSALAAHTFAGNNLEILDGKIKESELVDLVGGYSGVTKYSVDNGAQTTLAWDEIFGTDEDTQLDFTKYHDKTIRLYKRSGNVISGYTWPEAANYTLKIYHNVGFSVTGATGGTLTHTSSSLYETGSAEYASGATGIKTYHNEKLVLSLPVDTAGKVPIAKMVSASATTSIPLTEVKNAEGTLTGYTAELDSTVSGTVTVEYVEPAAVTMTIIGSGSVTVGGITAPDRATVLVNPESKSAAIVATPASGYHVECIKVGDSEVAPSSYSGTAAIYNLSIAANGSYGVEVKFAKNDVSYNGYYADGTALTADALAQLKQDIYDVLHIADRTTITDSDGDGALWDEVTIQYLPYHEWDIILVGSGTGFDANNIKDLNVAAPDDTDIVDQTNIYSNFGERAYNNGASIKTGITEKVRITYGSYTIDEIITLVEARPVSTITYNKPAVQEVEDLAEVMALLKADGVIAAQSAGTITIAHKSGALGEVGKESTIVYTVTVAPDPNYLGNTRDVEITVKAKSLPANITFASEGTGNGGVKFGNDNAGYINGDGELNTGTYTLTVTPDDLDGADGNAMYVDKVEIKVGDGEYTTVSGSYSGGVFTGSIDIENDSSYTIKVTYGTDELTQIGNTLPLNGHIVDGTIDNYIRWDGLKANMLKAILGVNTETGYSAYLWLDMGFGAQAGYYDVTDKPTTATNQSRLSVPKNNQQFQIVKAAYGNGKHVALTLTGTVNIVDSRATTVINPKDIGLSYETAPEADVLKAAILAEMEKQGAEIGITDTYNLGITSLDFSDNVTVTVPEYTFPGEGGYVDVTVTLSLAAGQTWQAASNKTATVRITNPQYKESITVTASGCTVTVYDKDGNVVSGDALNSLDAGTYYFEVTGVAEGYSPVVLVDGVAASPTEGKYSVTTKYAATTGDVVAHTINVTVAANTYTATWDANGGSWTVDGETKTKLTTEAAYGSNITVPADPTREGYTFKGWKDANGNAPGTMPLNGAVFTAQWEVNKYTVSFNSDGGSEVESITAAYGSKVTAPANPTKSGYVFEGWYKEAALTNKWNFATDTVPVDGIILYAKWEGATGTVFTIEYYYELTTGGYNETADESEQSAGTTDTKTNVKADDVPGFEAQEIVQQTITGDGKTVVKVYYNRIEYTITFDSNVASITAKYGVEVAEPTAPSKEHYTFAYWKDTNGNKVEFPVAMPLGGASYTAEWTPVNYTITFNSNGGTDVASITQGYGTEVKAPADPTRGGYVFDCWHDANGNKVTFPVIMPANGATYTATWKPDTNNNEVPDEDETITVVITGEGSGTVTINGTTVNNGDELVYKSNEAATIIATPAAGGTGYGYYVDGITGANVTGTYANTVYTATMDAGKGNVTLTITFGKRVISVHDQTVYVNGYRNLDNLTGLRNEYKATLIPSAFVNLEKCFGCDAESGKPADYSGFTLEMEYSNGFEMVYGSIDYAPTSAIDVPPTGRNVKITWAGDNKYPTVVSEAVYATIEDTRNAAVIGDLNVSDFGTFDTVAQFEAAVKAAVEATYKDKKNNSGEVPADYITVKASENPVVTVVDGKTVKTYSVTVSVRDGSNWLKAERTFTGLSWTVNQYEITWVDGNGVKLYSEKLDYGTTPEYKGATPTKADKLDDYGNVMATYTHDGWTPDIASVTGAATYTATFTEVAKTYTVKYVNEDGTVLKEYSVVYGGALPEYDGETPTKASDDPAVVYSHKGWEQISGKELLNKTVVSDMVFKATFTTDKVYTIQFIIGQDEDGKDIVYATDYINVEDEDTNDAITAPTGNPDESNTFKDVVFGGWDPELISTVPSGDALVIKVNAVWIPEVNDNNVLDADETATVVVTVTNNNGASGTVTIGNCHIADTVTDGNVTTYTVIYNSEAENGNVISVTATPTATPATEVEYYVTAPASVTVADDETANVAVTFDKRELVVAENLGDIEINKYYAALERADKLALADLKAHVLAAAGVSEADAAVAVVTATVGIQSLNVQATVTIGNDGVTDTSLGNGNTMITAGNTGLLMELAKDSYSFTITLPASGNLPEVSKTISLKVNDSRKEANVAHNGETYTAPALTDDLLKQIKEDITVTDGNGDAVSFTIKWGYDTLPELTAGQDNEVKVLVTVDYDDVYHKKVTDKEVLVTVARPAEDPKITILDNAQATYNTSMADESVAFKNNKVLAAVQPEYVPAGLDALKDGVKVEYLARNGESVPVVINAKILGIYEIKDLEVMVPVDPLWVNIGTEFVDYSDYAPDQAKYEEIAMALWNRYGTQLLNMDEARLKEIAADYIKNDTELSLYYQYLGTHQFGDNKNAEGKLEEQVRLVLETGEAYGTVTSNECTLILDDTRGESRITVNEGVTMTYGFTADELMAALAPQVYGTKDGVESLITGAEVEFITKVEGLNASEEGVVIELRFMGNENYKRCTATTTIIINKAPVTVNVDNQIVKYGTNYNKLPVSTDPADVDTIQFIVGLDISNVNVDTSEGANLGAIKGLVGNVQLLLPEELQNLLTTVDDLVSDKLGFNISFADGASMKLSDLQKAVDALDDLFTGSEYEEYFKVLLNMLKSLPTDTADIMITIGGELPTNVGVYLIGAVTADSNYETAFGIGVMAIYPDGIRAELDWKMDDENYIITRSLLTSGVFDASAVAISVGEGGTIEEATEQAYELFLGVDIDGKITIESDQTLLNVGAYLEVAMIVNWGNEMYYSAPIARPIVVVAETLDVEFIDANGDINNERKFVFDNDIQDGMENILVTYKQDGNGYAAGDKVADELYEVKYYYVGVQTNGMPYASTTAPLHAGAYTVTAIVTIRNDEGITHAGQGIGVLAIEPAQSDVYVDNAAIKFDDADHKVNDLVHASSAASTAEKPLTPDTTIISAGVAIDRTSSASGLEAIEGVVNVDLPVWLDELFAKYGILEAAYTETGITVSVFESYLDTIRDTLTELGIDTTSFDEVVAIIDQLPDTTTLTFHSDKAYSNVGAYLVLAVVTDSDHYPSVGAGLMLIYPDATKVELKFEEDWNDNNIFTWQALQTLNLDAQAYDLDTGNYNAAADEFVTNVYLGFTDDGKVLLTKDKSVLDNGVYTQVAFLLDLGTTMYYAEPISRVFMIVPNPVTITFVDKTGADNADRVFTFNNGEQGMDVIVTQNGVELANTLKDNYDNLTITYTGVQTNLETYNSTTPPTHAGTYVVTAHYATRDEQGRVVNLGAEVGAMVILPADSDITVNSAAIPYDGLAHSINAMVSASSAASTAEKPLIPDATIITASVNTNGSFSEDLLKAIEGSINIDLPGWADDVLAEYENVADGITVKGMISALDTVVAELTELNIETEVFTELRSVLEQLPGELTVTFNSNVEKTAVGVYLVIGLVTDSDHLPAMDVGYLVIYPEVIEVELEFNNIDSNGIFTNSLVEKFDFNATAYTVSDGEVNAAATKQIQHIFFGVDEEGNIVLKAGVDAAKQLPYGVYTQLSFIAQIDSVMYLAEPIVRPIIRVRDTVNVDFEDVETSYNGKAQGIGEVSITGLNGESIDVNAEALTVYYAGISTNGQPYWSETAPVHAGVYTVFAIYLDGENMGAHAGSLVITPAEAAIDVPSQAVKYGTEYDITVTVTPVDETIDPTDAKYLLVTAGTDTTVSGGKLSLSSINTINIDFPEAVDAVLDALNISDGITVGDFTGLAENIQAALDLIGYENEYLTQAMDLLKQMDEGVTVSFTDNYEPENVGVYFLIATVFDPDYMPAVDTGVLVIYPNGELVDIEFTTPIPGELNIMPYNTVVDFDFSAYTDNAETESMLNNVIFGLTTDGELFVSDGNAEGNPTELGVYTQVAYLDVDLNLADGNTIYVAIPEFRLFSVVPCDYDMIFVVDPDAQPLDKNEYRQFTYTGEPIEMPAVIVDAQGNKVEGLEPTVWYIGLDTTLDATWSTQAPTEAGIYNTVAYYFDEAANIYVMATGVMVIRKAASEFTLYDNIVIYDGTEKFTTMLDVMHNPNNADAVYVIIDRDENVANILLEDDLSAIVEAINDVLSEAGKQLPTSAYVDVTDFKAAVAEVLADAESLSEKLPESISETVDEVLELMNEALDKLPNDGTVAINSDKPVHVGTYEVYAVSYSANYTPAASAAELVIEPIKLVIEAEDKTKTYGDADPELTYVVKADGIVKDVDDIPGLTVTISRAEGEEAGEYTITVTAQCSDSNYEIVAVTNGTLTITEKPVTGYSISGKITTYNDLPMSVTVYLMKGDEEVASTTTDAEGNYSFESLEAGTYSVKVTKDYYVSRNVEVALTDADATLDLKIYLKGDVNMNGKVDIIDHQRLFEHLNGSKPITDADQLAIADVNEAGGVNILDHQRLFEHLNGSKPLV